MSGIIAGAIYAYNIFDAVTSKGAKIYALNENNSVQIFAGLNNKVDMPASDRSGGGSYIGGGDHRGRGGKEFMNVKKLEPPPSMTEH